MKSNTVSCATNASPLAGRRPNVLLVLMDDMGFSDLRCYGGEIETPNVDSLAKSGVRFTQFYNAGRCWPTRSSILTGYYASQVLMDPPDLENRPSWQRLLPHYLRLAGYRSYHSGKWHIMNTREPEKTGEFDKSWGYEIEHGSHFFTKKYEGKFSATAITDHALQCLREHEASYKGTPFFQYVCYTTPHFPLQAEQQDIDKYANRYNEGWDVIREQRWKRQREMGIVNCSLSQREPEIPAPHYLKNKEKWSAKFGPGEIEYAVAWDSLTEEQKRFQATKMAIHAAMVDRTDREFGRILDQLKKMNVYEDTLILFLSDNGASAEMMIRGQGHDPSVAPGSKKTHLCLGPGWSTCSNTPFRRHKIWVHEGGVSTPLVASWPNGIKAHGELRHDMGHCIDFLPTILELAGVKLADIPLPAGAPALPGKSLLPTMQCDGSVQRSHIFFNHAGNRGLRMDNWKIVNETSTDQGSNQDRWALYDLSKDRCERVDLSSKHPEILKEMQEYWQTCEDKYRTKVENKQ